MNNDQFKSSKMITEIWYENGYLIPYFKQFKRHLKANARVLELGCNIGFNAKNLAELGCNVVGVDSSKELVDIAISKNPNIKFLVDDMRNDLSYLGVFDGILIMGSLSHIKIKELPLVLNNIYNLLEDEGYIFFITRNNLNLENDDNVSDLYEKFHNREVFAHQREILDLEMQNKFVFIEELQGDDNWNFLIYKKNTIK